VLSPEELAELEASLLPALERHHLRLLAHSLRSLQAAAGHRSGPLPDRAALMTWALDQPELQADAGFCQAFLDQLQGAGIQLVRRFSTPARSPPPTAQVTCRRHHFTLAGCIIYPSAVVGCSTCLDAGIEVGDSGASTLHRSDRGRNTTRRLELTARLVEPGRLGH
jgi:hypothetical protein